MPINAITWLNQPLNDLNHKVFFINGREEYIKYQVEQRLEQYLINQNFKKIGNIILENLENIQDIKIITQNNFFAPSRYLKIFIKPNKFTKHMQTELSAWLETLGGDLRVILKFTEYTSKFNKWAEKSFLVINCWNFTDHLQARRYLDYTLRCKGIKLNNEVKNLIGQYCTTPQAIKQCADILALDPTLTPNLSYFQALQASVPPDPNELIIKCLAGSEYETFSQFYRLISIHGTLGIFTGLRQVILLINDILTRKISLNSNCLPASVNVKNAIQQNIQKFNLDLIKALIAELSLIEFHLKQYTNRKNLELAILAIALSLAQRKIFNIGGIQP